MMIGGKSDAKGGKKGSLMPRYGPMAVGSPEAASHASTRGILSTMLFISLMRKLTK